MKYWLSRLSLPAMVVAVALAWPAYSALRGRGAPMPPARIYLQFALAAGCIVLAMVGAHYRRLGH